MSVVLRILAGIIMVCLFLISIGCYSLAGFCFFAWEQVWNVRLVCGVVCCLVGYISCSASIDFYYEMKG